MNLGFSLPLLAAVAVFFVFVLLIMKVARARRGKSEEIDAEYQARPAIFSYAERSFVGVLESVLPKDVTVFGKVRLGDVFLPRKGLTPSRRTSAWNRINQKHVDFLLVNKSDYAPLAGIELDDKSHDDDERKDRDQFVDQVFASGNLPLLHIRAAATYNVSELRTKIAALLGSSTEPPKIS